MRCRADERAFLGFMSGRSTTALTRRDSVTDRVRVFAEDAGATVAGPGTRRSPAAGDLFCRHRGRRRGLGFVPLTVTTFSTCLGHSSAPPPCRLGGFARLLASLDVVTVPTRNLTTVSIVDGSGCRVGPTPVGLCRAVRDRPRSCAVSKRHRDDRDRGPAHGR